MHRIWGFRLARRRVRCLRSNESYPVKPEHWETAMGIKSYSAAPTAVLALGLFFTPWLFDRPLALAAGVTTLAIVYLILLLRQRRLTASKLTFAALGYVAFAAAFIWLRP